MREQKLKALIRIVEESKIDELEISRWGKKIRICKSSYNGRTVQGPPLTAAFSAPEGPATREVIPPQPAAPAILPPPEIEKAPPPKDTVEIKSPMVGTFYRRPAPEADPYVEVGDTVARGQVLCIIEAMKLMNEIESEANGVIEKILVENAQPVEYNQPLFLVRKM